MRVRVRCGKVQDKIREELYCREEALSLQRESVDHAAVPYRTVPYIPIAIERTVPGICIERSGM
jgi:hypothetical protein